MRRDACLAQATGYYYNAETGYYFDANKKLYYHPNTPETWYQVCARGRWIARLTMLHSVHWAVLCSVLQAA